MASRDRERKTEQDGSMTDVMSMFQALMSRMDNMQREISSKAEQQQQHVIEQQRQFAEIKEQLATVQQESARPPNRAGMRRRSVILDPISQLWKKKTSALLKIGTNDESLHGILIEGTTGMIGSTPSR